MGPGGRGAGGAGGGGGMTPPQGPGAGKPLECGVVEVMADTGRDRIELRVKDEELDMELRSGRVPTFKGKKNEVAVEWFAEAPGRLDVLGGVADLGGALTLQYPVESTGITVRMRVCLGEPGPGQPHKVVVHDESGCRSTLGGSPPRRATIELAPILENVARLPTELLCPETRAVGVATKNALKQLRELPQKWAHHVAGCILGMHVQGSKFGWGSHNLTGLPRDFLSLYPPWSRLEIWTNNEIWRDPTTKNCPNNNFLPQGQGAASSAAVQVRRGTHPTTPPAAPNPVPSRTMKTRYYTARFKALLPAPSRPTVSLTVGACLPCRLRL